MNVGPARWLLDVCLPQSSYSEIDAIHASDFMRVPGPAGLREAQKLDRALVTCAEEFRGPCALSLQHPGVVIFEKPPPDAAEIERNLKHLEFRISQYGGELEVAGNRFVIRADKEILLVGSDGEEISLEPWKEVHMNKAPAYAV